jgi:hypothetical protein
MSEPASIPPADPDQQEKLIDPPEQRGQRTRPWSPDEVVRVDGRDLVYTVDRRTGAVTMHLHGGAQTTPSALRRARHRVVMPKELRTNDFN